MENSTSLPDRPAAIPPPGVTPNYTDPVSRAHIMIAITTTCLSFMVILHLQRMYIKIRKNHAWGWDDCCCTIGKLGSIGYAAVCLSTIQSGTGTHQWDVPISALTPLFLKKLYATQLLLPITFMAIKSSLFMLYLHLFGPNKKLRFLVYVGMVVNVLFYSTCLGAQILVWMPSSGQPWFKTTVSPGYPMATELGVIQSSFNVVSDFYLLLLPLGGVLQLQLPLRKKLGVAAIFMTGALACISSVLTLIYRVKLVGDPDTTWDLGIVFTLTNVETTVGIMCSCMPALATFVRLHSPMFMSLLSIFGTTAKRSSAKKSSNGSSTGEMRSQDNLSMSQRHLHSTSGGSVDVVERADTRDIGAEEASIGVGM